MDVDSSIIQEASKKIFQAMRVIPKGESRSLYELAKESGKEFLDRRRHGGKQDLILLDSILSIGRRYKLVVEWAEYYSKYVKTRGLEQSLETLARLDLTDYKTYLKSIGVPNIPNQSRVEFAVRFARLFLRKYPRDLHGRNGLFRWVEDSEGWTQFLKDYNRRGDVCRSFTDFMLKEYNRPLPEGRTLIGLSVFQYLRMQCGEDTLKPDRRVIAILKKLLGVSRLDATECIEVASRISKELGIRLIELDQMLVSEDILSCEQKFETFLRKN
jgi:hypothetical protein